MSAMLDDLYQSVTSAIFAAEHVDDPIWNPRGLSKRDAWREVARIEEAIVVAIAPDDVERPLSRELAQRGAVRARLRAGDRAEARALARAYSTNEPGSPGHRDALAQLLQQAEEEGP